MMNRPIKSPFINTPNQKDKEFYKLRQSLIREIVSLKDSMSNILSEHISHLNEKSLKLDEVHNLHIESIKNLNSLTEQAQLELERAKEIQKGDAGPQGIPGETPVKGVHYNDGQTPIIDHEHIINEVSKRVPTPKDGTNGENAIVDHNFIVNEVAKKIKIPKIDEKKLGKLVQDKIQEHLTNTPKSEIHIDEVKGFKEAIAPINTNISRYLLSGTGDTVIAGSGIAITTDSDGNKVITSTASTTVYTETPSGAINSVNTSYTVLHTITTVIGLWINGQYIHTSEYSASGTTITMVSALPTELSGTGFTISYV